MRKRTNDLPFNHDAETVVLGSAMISNDALYKIMSALEETDFYEGKHQLIYRAILSLNTKKIDVEIYTVTEELLLMNVLDDIGGVDYLKECSDKVVALSSIDFYINIVKDNSNLRNLLTTIRDINNDYLNTQIDSIEDFIKDSEQRIKDATKNNRVSSFKSIETVANEAVLQIYNQKNSGDGFTTGITSGFTNVNKFTNGFQRGEVTIVGARTSVGKTSLALNMAYKAARSGTTVAIFELEMTAESLAKRMIAMASNVSLNKIMTGNLSDIDKVKVNHAGSEIISLPIFIDDGANSLIDIETKCRQLIEKYPELGLVVVDHMSIVKVVGGKKSDSRVDEMRKISQGLHALAKDLDIAILAVAQLNRDSVKGEVKRPKMVDIKESGAIEQDADVILLLYDPLYENNKIKKKTNLPEDVRHIEVIVAKQRNGNTGIADLIFYKQFCRFDIPSDEWQREIAAMRNEN
jgi:replicative DNA helicase